MLHISLYEPDFPSLQIFIEMPVATKAFGVRSLEPFGPSLPTWCSRGKCRERLRLVGNHPR